MQEIKLNEPFTLESKMVKIVECEPTNGQWSYPYSQPKKERWFKCLASNYVTYEKNRIYLGSHKFTKTQFPCEEIAKMNPCDWQEVQPDFICQHSGEAFMMGDACWYIIRYDKNDNPDSGRIDKFDTEEGKDMAYFHSESDALAWQEAKFGKKEEDIIEWDFDYKTYEIRKFNKSKEVIDTPFVGYKSESDCIAARDKWIWENVKVSGGEMLEIMKDCFSSAIKPKESFVKYILNKGGK